MGEIFLNSFLYSMFFQNVSCRLFFVSHILVGTIEAAAVFMTYFVFMADKGFLPRTLVALNIAWHDDMLDDITDSFGQEWVGIIMYICISAGSKPS